MAKKTNDYIVPLTCPNCRSSECIETGENSFQCKHCKTKFIYRQDAPHTVNNTTIYNGRTQPPVDAKKIVWGLVVFFIAIGFFIAIPSMFRSNKYKSTAASSSSKKDRGSVEYAVPVPGKDHVNIGYYISRRNWKGKDCTFQAVLEMVNPRTNKILKEIILGENEKSGAVIHHQTPIVYAGGKCWILLENGVMAIDPLSFEEAETNKTLTGRHERLASGLLRCRFENGENTHPYLTLNTKDGKKYIYIMEVDKVYTEKEYEAIKSNLVNTMPACSDGRAAFYFDNYVTGEGRTRKNFLYKINCKAPVYFDYEPHLGKGVNFTPERTYFSPKVHYTDNECVVISYMNDADEDNSPRIMQCLSANDGTVRWTCAENVMRDMENYWTRAVVAGTAKNRELVFCTIHRSLSKEKTRAVGVNMSDGRILFTLKGEFSH